MILILLNKLETNTYKAKMLDRSLELMHKANTRPQDYKRKS